MPANIEKKELKSGEVLGPVDKVLVERRKDVVIPKEARDWLKELERHTKPNTSQMTALANGAAISGKGSSAGAKKKTLPANKRVFMQGFNKGVGEVGRWFSVFVLRMIKMNPNGVEFKPE